jgi:hypothetical protein
MSRYLWYLVSEAVLAGWLADCKVLPTVKSPGRLSNDERKEKEVGVYVVTNDCVFARVS